jgi:hypothetical protein
VIKKNFSEYLSSDDPRYREDTEDVQKVFCDKTFLECIFIDRDYFVQTISDEDESVLVFSVTTRSPQFHPVFQLPYKVGWRERRQWKRRTGEEFKPIFRVRLGQTRFADLDRGDPDEFTGIHFRAWIGARTFSYSEDHYYGNPGYYQTFVFTTSSNAPALGGISGLGEAIQEAGGEEWPDQSREDQPDWKDMPKTQTFRRNSVITTYTVIGVGLSLDNYPSRFFGPNGDDVRTLP